MYMKVMRKHTGRNGSKPEYLAVHSKVPAYQGPYQLVKKLLCTLVDPKITVMLRQSVSPKPNSETMSSEFLKSPTCARCRSRQPCPGGFRHARSGTIGTHAPANGRRRGW
ncbi:unnamed protein product [Ectocarpus sp. 12 AP-2014]